MECRDYFVHLIKRGAAILGWYVYILHLYIKLSSAVAGCRYVSVFLIFIIPLCKFYTHTETEQGIFRQILQGRLDFQSEPWPGISDSAKDLIRKMLDRNPKNRFTAHQVLCKSEISHRAR